MKIIETANTIKMEAIAITIAKNRSKYFFEPGLHIIRDDRWMLLNIWEAGRQNKITKPPKGLPLKFSVTFEELGTILVIFSGKIVATALKITSIGIGDNNGKILIPT